MSPERLREALTMLGDVITGQHVVRKRREPRVISLTVVPEPPPPPPSPTTVEEFEGNHQVHLAKILAVRRKIRIARKRAEGDTE